MIYATKCRKTLYSTAIYMVVQEIDGTYIFSLQNGVETSIEKKHTDVTENHCTAASDRGQSKCTTPHLNSPMTVR